MNRPLGVVRKNGHIQVNLDVPRVFNGHVHVDLLAAVNRNIRGEVVGTNRTVVVLEMDIERFLGKNRDGHGFGEIHRSIGKRCHVAGNRIRIASSRQSVSHERDKDSNRHGEILQNVERFKVQLRGVRSAQHHLPALV